MKDRFGNHVNAIFALVNSEGGREALLMFVASEARLAQMLGDDVFGGEPPHEELDKDELLYVNVDEIVMASKSIRATKKWFRKKKLWPWAKKLLEKLNGMVSSLVGGGEG